MPSGGSRLWGGGGAGLVLLALLAFFLQSFLLFSPKIRRGGGGGGLDLPLVPEADILCQQLIVHMFIVIMYCTT